MKVLLIRTGFLKVRYSNDQLAKQTEMLHVPKLSVCSFVGLQRYTELSSIRDMGSGEQAYRIASSIFAKFANFLEPVIVLKIGKFPDKIYLCFNSHWQPLFPGEM